MTKLETKISYAKISEDDLKNWQTIPIEKVNSIKDKLNIPHDLEVRMIDMNLCMNFLSDISDLLDSMKINYDNTFYVDVSTKTSDQIRMFNKILILKKGYSLRTSCDYYVDHNLTIKFRTMLGLGDILSALSRIL